MYCLQQESEIKCSTFKPILMLPCTARRFASCKINVSTKLRQLVKALKTNGTSTLFLIVFGSWDTQWKNKTTASLFFLLVLGTSSIFKLRYILILVNKETATGILATKPEFRRPWALSFMFKNGSLAISKIAQVCASRPHILVCMLKACISVP